MTAVDLLIRGACIDAFDEAGTQIVDGAIAISGNRIQWIGSSAEIDDLFEGKEIINAVGMIAMPGFVDAHVHTAQQFLH